MAPVADVVVFTDSTCYLPAGLAEQWQVRVVPLTVRIGERTGLEGTQISSGEVAAALTGRRRVTTSRPNPAEFLAAYQQALDDGAQSLVSIHLSARLSGTYEAALLAAKQIGHGRVRVVDSRVTAMALGFAVEAAAKTAADGGSQAAVAAAALDCVAGESALFYVDSLEWLRAGGRIGLAAALLGGALSIKPLMRLVDGMIVPIEKVRTASKALSRLRQLAVDAAADRQVDLAIQHLAAPERAELLADELSQQVRGLRRLYVSELGAVVGAHTGPGLIGVIIRRW